VQEIAPGLWHWTAVRTSIGIEVSSYLLAAERVVLDPMLPAEGLEWFEEHGRPEHVVLTCRHHDRDAWALRDAFGCTVHVVESGAHELEGRGPYETFAWGDELPGGLRAEEVGALSPDETAFHVPAHGALAVGDGAVRWPGREGLSFVPDEFMDDPERTKAGLRAAYRRLLELDFDRLLLAHGGPVTEGAKDELRALVESS
jgi:glyoxylase-like metal-dependent hydrolase (beta-lactamase superfamily II)